MSVYLALKEMWRRRGRFFLFSLVIALITVLVLFIAALADGLGNGNKEYIEKLNGQLVVYNQNVDLSIGASRLDRAKLNAVRRTAGITDAGAVSFASVALIHGSDQKQLNTALIGVEPGKPGEPPVVAGRGLEEKRAKEAIIDRNVAVRTGLGVGDELVIKSIQGTDEKFYTLRVIGVSDGRQYSLQPSIIVPLLTFERIKPQAAVNENADDIVSNVIVARVETGAPAATAQTLEREIAGIRAVDLKTAYENTPGYGAQQSTLNTQRFFTLLIGVLVIGGFFQIQTLQKVPQIGMLKAIGTPNHIVAITALAQIIAVTIVGVALGTAVTLLLALGFPATVPIIFSAQAIVLGVGSLVLIGPLGGMVSVRYALRVEPLMALGLSV